MAKIPGPQLVTRQLQRLTMSMARESQDQSGDSYGKHHGGKPVVFERVAGVVQCVAEPGGDSQQLGRHQHHP